MWRSHRSNEGLNVKMFQIKLGFALCNSPVISGTEQANSKQND